MNLKIFYWMVLYSRIGIYPQRAFISTGINEPWLCFNTLYIIQESLIGVIRSWQSVTQSNIKVPLAKEIFAKIWLIYYDRKPHFLMYIGGQDYPNHHDWFAMVCMVWTMQTNGKPNWPKSNHFVMRTSRIQTNSLTSKPIYLKPKTSMQTILCHPN